MKQPDTSRKASVTKQGHVISSGHCPNSSVFAPHLLCLVSAAPLATPPSLSTLLPEPHTASYSPSNPSHALRHRLLQLACGGPQICFLQQISFAPAAEAPLVVGGDALHSRQSLLTKLDLEPFYHLAVQTWGHRLKMSDAHKATAFWGGIVSTCGLGFADTKISANYPHKIPPFNERTYARTHARTHAREQASRTIDSFTCVVGILEHHRSHAVGIHLTRTHTRTHTHTHARTRISYDPWEVGAE